MNVAETFKAVLVKKAAQAGVDITGLEVETATMDHTWGQRVGLFFSGPHAQRAAECFTKWATRERLGSSYESQHSLGSPETFHRTICKANGVKSHGRGEFTAPDYEKNPAEYIAGFEVVMGVAVSYVYYSDAD